MSSIKKIWLLTLLSLLAIQTPVYAVLRPTFSQAFKNTNFINIEVSVDIPEKLLVSSKNTFVSHIKNSIFVELKAKLPSSVKVYKDVNLEQEFYTFLEANNLLDESGEWTEEGWGKVESLLDFFVQVGHMRVVVFVSENFSGGYYYGVTSLDFLRSASVTTFIDPKDSFSFDASVYNNLFIISGSTGLEKQVTDTVNKMVVEFIAHFYEGRSDL